MLQQVDALKSPNQTGHRQGNHRSAGAIGGSGFPTDSQFGGKLTMSHPT
jgi:hypothetical protein